MELSYKNRTTPVLIGEIKIEESYKQSLINDIIDRPDEKEKDVSVYAKMSHFSLHKLPLYNNVVIKISEYITENYPIDTFVDPSHRDYVYRMSTLWGLEYRNGDGASKHTHNTEVSFCYYLKADENASPLVFPFLDYQVKPKSDMIIAFNGSEAHEVPNQDIDSERVLLAGNFIVSS